MTHFFIFLLTFTPYFFVDVIFVLIYFVGQYFAYFAKCVITIMP